MVINFPMLDQRTSVLHSAVIKKGKCKYVGDMHYNLNQNFNERVLILVTL